MAGSVAGSKDIGEEKIKMVSEKVSRKMVLEINYVNANNAVILTENSKINQGTGIWAKFRLGNGIWYPPSRPSRVDADTSCCGLYAFQHSKITS